MVEHLTGHAFVVWGLSIVLVKQSSAVESEQTQQHALDDPAGPAQSSITASLAHTLTCVSRKELAATVGLKKSQPLENPN